jgi:hypothetical protein
MRKRLTAILLGGTAALALGLGTATAMATTTTTWTIKPGGAVTGTAGKTIFKDTATGATLTCKSSASVATLKKGSGLTNPLGAITSVTFSSCIGPNNLTFTATASASTTHPWHLIGLTYLSGVTHGKITGIMGSLSGNGCSATLAGTTATTPGTLSGTYTNSTHSLKNSGGNLHIWNVSGCLGLINNGDPSSIAASYTISPPQTVTSP